MTVDNSGIRTSLLPRKSAWKVRDGWKLIESVCGGCPIPSVFLHKSKDSRGLRRTALPEVVLRRLRNDAAGLYGGTTTVQGDS